MLKAGCPWVAVSGETALSKYGKLSFKCGQTVKRTVKKGLPDNADRPFGGLQRRYAFFSFSFINYSFIEAGSMVTVMQFFFPRMTSLANFWISAEVRVL